MMGPMVVLTAKRDGGTQDVVAFADPDDPLQVRSIMEEAEDFLRNAYFNLHTRRAIARIEVYNPDGDIPP